jgi:hypothetical protein
VSVGSVDATDVLRDGRGQAGIYAIDPSNTSESAASPTIESFTNLKYLAQESDNLIALRFDNSGNAQLVRFNESNTLASLDLTNTTVYQTSVEITPTDGKNSLFIDGNIAYIAAGVNGLVSYNLTTSAIVEQIDFIGENEFGNEELGGAVSAVWGDDNFLYVSAGSAFVIIPKDATGDILEENAKRIPLSYLVGDVNEDGVKNVLDNQASQASINYAYPVSSTDSSNPQALVALGRAGVVLIDINMN